MNPNVAELARLANYPLMKRWRYDWPTIEADLGIRLPGEYKEYVSYFPPGDHGGLITPEHPALRDGSLSFRDHILLAANVLRQDDRQESMRFYPDPGGLIPWAMYESTVALCWLPDNDDPDLWPVFAYDEEHARELIPGSTIQALIHVLRAEAGQLVLPSTFYARRDRYGDPLQFNGDEGSPLVKLPPVEYVNDPGDNQQPRPTASG